MIQVKYLPKKKKRIHAKYACMRHPAQLTASTNVANGTVNWNVVGDQPSHSGNPSTPNPGLTSSFVPTPTHPAYSSANAHSPTLTYAYTVTATVAGASNPSPLFVIVQINLADRLIQEYVNHLGMIHQEGNPLRNHSLSLSNIPNQTMLLPEICSQHFCSVPFGDNLNGGNYSLIVNGTMVSVAEQILTNYNGLINDPNTTYYLRITSGYRNPERNESVGGGINSYHQFGRALDLKPVTFPSNFTQLQTWNFIVSAANPIPGVTNVICETDTQEIRCTGEDGLPNHIHVEFNP